MKFEKQVSLKWAIALVLIACLVSSSIVYYVFAVSPSSTFTISSGVYPGAPSYTIWREGGYYFAKDANGEIDYSGTNASQIINYAINSLTSGRTWIETVLLKGSFTLTSEIILANYTRLVMYDAKLFLANGVNRPMIRNYNPKLHSRTIEIFGGYLDGNKDGQTLNATVDGHGVCGIEFTNTTDFTIKDTYIENAHLNGIALASSGYGLVSNVHSNKNLWDGITILYNSFAITVSDCHLYQNGRAGIVADGVYADVKVSVVNIIGNTVVGSLGLEPVSGGIVLEWSREILVSNNQVYDCVENCYDSGYGIEAASVSFSEISSNVVYHNDAIGIYLQCDAQNNLIKDNKVTGSGDSGIVVFNAVGAGNNAIIGNQIYDSLAHGILVYQSNRTFVSGNSLANNGAGASGSSGIYLSASSNCTVSFNKVYDSDDYELKIGSGSNYNMVVGNDLRQTAPGTHTGSFLNSGTGTKAHDNLGDSGWLAET